MKTPFRFFEYYKSRQGSTFSLPLIYVKGKWEAKPVYFYERYGVGRAIPPNKVRDNIDRASARSILWLWRKRNEVNTRYV